MRKPFLNAVQQQGFVLVTAMILLGVLAVLGVVAMRGSLFTERISANDRDIAAARQNAELALRDAERDILGKRFDGSYCGTAATCRTAGTRPISDADSVTFWSTDVVAPTDVASADGGSGLMAGMFDAMETQVQCQKPVWMAANWNDGVSRACAGSLTTTVPTVEYGTFTGATLGTPGFRNPRYLIELFRAVDLPTANTSDRYYFRITAVGFGRTQILGGNPVSVTLQSVFSPR